MKPDLVTFLSELSFGQTCYKAGLPNIHLSRNTRNIHLSVDEICCNIFILWYFIISSLKRRKTIKEQTMTLTISREKFIKHIKRICRSNIRKPCKICLTCPFREYVLEIMRERNWKLPEEEKL